MRRVLGMEGRPRGWAEGTAFGRGSRAPGPFWRFMSALGGLWVEILGYIVYDALAVGGLGLFARLLQLEHRRQARGGRGRAVELDELPFGRGEALPAPAFAHAERRERVAYAVDVAQREEGAELGHADAALIAVQRLCGYLKAARVQQPGHALD